MLRVSVNKKAVNPPNKLSEKQIKNDITLNFSAKTTARPVTKRQINVEIIGVAIESLNSLNGFKAPKITTSAKIDAMYLNDEIESPLNIYPSEAPKAEIVRYFLPPVAENATANGEKLVLKPEKLKINPKIKLKNVIIISRLLNLNTLLFLT